MFRSRAVRLKVGLLLLTAALYTPHILHSDFVYEDWTAMGYTPTSTIGPLAWTRPRILAGLSFRFDQRAGGMGPIGPHTTNVAIHLVNASLVSVIAETVAGAYAGPVAMGIFLLHPIQTEAVAYAAGRTELLSVWCLLVAVVVLMHAVSLRALLVAAACALLSLAGKETHVGLVALILAGCLWSAPEVVRDAWHRSRWALTYWLGVLGIVGIGFVVRQVFRYDYHHASMGRWTYEAVNAVAVWTLLGRIVVPWSLSIDHDFQIRIGWQTLALLAGELAIVAIGCRMLALVRRREACAWETPVWCMAGWILIDLAPRFVLRLPEYVNEHQMYASMVAVAVCAGWAADYYRTVNIHRRYIAHEYARLFQTANEVNALARR